MISGSKLLKQLSLLIFLALANIEQTDNAEFGVPRTRPAFASIRDRLRRTPGASRVYTPDLIFVAAWEFLVPFPGALDYRVERLELRFPAKFVFDFR